MLDLTPPTLPLRTERLVLRPFVVDDIDSVYAYRSRPDVVKYTYRAAHASREETMAYLGRNITFPKADGDWFALGVELPGRPGVIGEALLKFTSLDAEQGEIGYVFTPDVAGCGYATEAVAAIVGVAFGHFGFHRLIARIDEANSASVRVAERLGMRLEARLVENDRLDGEWSTEVDYAILRREWEARGEVSPREANAQSRNESPSEGTPSGDDVRSAGDVRRTDVENPSAPNSIGAQR